MNCNPSIRIKYVVSIMSFDSVHLLSLSLSLHGERKNIGLCNSQEEEGCDCALTVMKRDVQIEKVCVSANTEK